MHGCVKAQAIDLVEAMNGKTLKGRLLPHVIDYDTISHVSKSY